jgi:Reverse transcriptase (RNA-dependent DNA polymerase)
MELKAGGTLWSMMAHTLQTNMSQPVCSKFNVDPVQDSGAMQTIGGLKSILGLASKFYLPYEMMSLDDNDYRSHSYGPSEGNAVQDIICKCKLGLRTQSGTLLFHTLYVTETNDPILLGANFWEDSILRPVSHPWENRTYLRLTGKQDFFHTYCDSSLGGLRRVSVNMPKIVTSFSTRFAKEKSPIEIVIDVHRKTHASYSDIQLLLERTGIWTDATRAQLDALRANCEICLSQSDPKPSTKYGLKMSPEFNLEVSMDIAYLDANLLNLEEKHASELGSQKQLLIFHIMCDRTWLSECTIICNRALPMLLELLQVVWTHRHGLMQQLAFDAEFDKPAILAFLKANAIKAKIIPKDVHNKLRVERKNRTVKLFVRKIRQAYKDQTLSWTISYATFLSNIFYGSKPASPFEVSRGFTPRITGGAKATPLSDSIFDAFLNDRATQTLNSILKHNFHQNRVPPFIRVGDRVLCYSPKSFGKRGMYSPYVVHFIPPHRAWLTVKPNRTEIRFAPENVLLRPKNSLAARITDHRTGYVPSERNSIKPAAVENAYLPQAPLEFSLDFMQSALAEDSESDDGEDVVEPELQIIDVQADESNTISDAPDLLNGLQGRPNVSNESDEQGSSNVPLVPENVMAHVHELPLDGPPPRRSGRQRRKPMKFTSLSCLALTQTVAIDLRDEMFESWLKQIYSKHQGHEATRSKLSWVPDWVLDKALSVESANWLPIVNEMLYQDVSPQENIISSHTLYRVKVADDGKFSLKARIVPHGNRDKEKENIRGDSEVADHTSYRTVLALSAILNLPLFKVDVKAAFLQTGPAKRVVFVRPPSDLLLPGKLWKLLTTTYGLTEANRIFQRQSDDVIVDPGKMGMQSVHGVKQLFIKRNSTGKIVLLIAKQVDDVLGCGIPEAQDWFITQFDKFFKIGTIVKSPERIRFDGGYIETMDSGEVVFTMDEYLQAIPSILLTRERRRLLESKVTISELKEYQNRCGKFCWLGMMAFPLGHFYGSHLQQAVGDLRVKHLILCNTFIKEAQRMSATLVYRKPNLVKPVVPRILVFTDAGGIHKDTNYYQQGEIIGLGLGLNADSPFYVLDWKSSKQKRVAQSPGAAETIAAHTGVYRGMVLRDSLEQILCLVIPLDLTIDSMSLYRSMVTSHDPVDLSMRRDVVGIRDLYGAEIIHTMRWIAGTSNPADPMTKANTLGTRDVLCVMLNNGLLGLTMISKFAQNSIQSDLPHVANQEGEC